MKLARCCQCTHSWVGRAETSPGRGLYQHERSCSTEAVEIASVVPSLLTSPGSRCNDNSCHIDQLPTAARSPSASPLDAHTSPGVLSSGSGVADLVAAQQLRSGGGSCFPASEFFDASIVALWQGLPGERCNGQPGADQREGKVTAPGAKIPPSNALWRCGLDRA